MASASLNTAGKILKGIDGFANGVEVGMGAILESNKAINPIKTMGKFVLGESDTGIRGTLNAMSRGDKFTKALGSAYKKAGSESIKGMGDINWKAVGGTYVGAAVAGRVLTGGGIYRDSSGNTNLPVIPYV